MNIPSLERPASPENLSKANGEISSEVADGTNAVILEQVTNGIAVRMAVLFLVSQGHDAMAAPEEQAA